MITEDYCSYEVAKLLREKGFNEPVTELNKLFFKEDEKPVLKITHQKAMKWLREERNLTIEPYFEYLIGYSIDIKYTDKKTNIEQFEELREKWFNTYEEATEAAIKYCLEHLI